MTDVKKLERVAVTLAVPFFSRTLSFEPVKR